MMASVSIEIPSALEMFAETALTRLGYLHPDVQWNWDGRASRITAEFNADRTAAETLRKEALFQLYRERVFTETAELRSRLYQAV